LNHSAHPVVTLPLATEMLGASKPTAIKATEALGHASTLKEASSKRHDRAYA